MGELCKWTQIVCIFCYFLNYQLVSVKLTEKRKKEGEFKINQYTQIYFKHVKYIHILYILIKKETKSLKYYLVPQLFVT